MDQSKSASNNAPPKNIIETATDAGIFASFIAGLKAAGLIDALKNGKGPFTVFAPTDEAIISLTSGAYEFLLKDPTKLKTVMNYHVVSGRFMWNDLKSGEVMTQQGSTFTVAILPELRINGSRVTQTDIVASNGVIHAIESVLVPRHLQLLAAAA